MAPTRRVIACRQDWMAAHIGLTRLTRLGGWAPLGDAWKWIAQGEHQERHAYSGLTPPGGPRVDRHVDRVRLPANYHFA